MPFGTEELAGKMPSAETIQKTKSCVLTFRCLKKDACQNFLNYVTVIDFKIATRTQGCCIKLPKVSLKIGKKGFYFHGGKLFTEFLLNI